MVDEVDVFDDRNRDGISKFESFNWIDPSSITISDSSSNSVIDFSVKVSTRLVDGPKENFTRHYHNLHVFLHVGAQIGGFFGKWNTSTSSLVVKATKLSSDKSKDTLELEDKSESSECGLISMVSWDFTVKISFGGVNLQPACILE